MATSRVLALACALIGLTVGAASGVVNIDTVPVGYIGNPADMRYHLDQRPEGFGRVDYAYRMGKYEVTAGQYAEFLNAVAKADPYGLYCTDMWSDSKGCKIQRRGSSGSYSYAVAVDLANRPVNFVSWGDAARFANWLHNRQPVGAQGPATTESGAYLLKGATSDADLLAVKRAPNATWVIPSEDEWYKAAYHRNNGVTGDYWDYPTSSNAAPGRNLEDADGNNANYYAGRPLVPVEQDRHATPVGEFQKSAGPYGTFDQGGNVFEWNEAVLFHAYRGMRGGSFGDFANNMSAVYRSANYPAAEFWSIGFRVAQVAGPATQPALTSNEADDSVAERNVIKPAPTTTQAAHAARLGPQDLLLIYNARNQDSRALAEYYAQVRGVPADRLLGLELKAETEEIPADEYERSLRGPVRARLEQNGLGDRVRCLVTFYGLPIRVGPQTLTPEQARLSEKWRSEFRAGLKTFATTVGELEPAATRPAANARDTSPDMEAEFRRLQQQYGQARAAGFKRAAAEAATPQGQAQFKQLLEVMQKVEGLAAVIEQANVKVQAPGADAARQLETLKQVLKADDQRIRELLNRGLEDPAREEARNLVLQNYGLSGRLLSLSSDMTQLRTEETQAAVDSELALVRWDAYPKYRWVVNPQSWRNRAEQAGQEPRPPTPPVMMVSRIDGPTPAIARGLIDKALAGEQAGPKGNVYIDSRGLSPTKSGFGPYDEYLRRIAGTIKTKTSLPVRLDNREALFKPGECPQTVLYCGWYSVRKYIDAFEFVPGAVGFHIASFEAASLKQPNEQGWCKRLLEKGITATLGPVAEPYLHSFPRPDDFFGLLLTGRFTLAEVYAYSVPFHSWMQMLIGDPLYRPFASSPQLPLDEAVPAEMIPPEYRATTRPGA